MLKCVREFIVNPKGGGNKTNAVKMQVKNHPSQSTWWKMQNNVVNTLKMGGSESYGYVELNLS